jgi:hypothetical protein
MSRWIEEEKNTEKETEETQALTTTYCRLFLLPLPLASHLALAGRASGDGRS